MTILDEISNFARERVAIQKNKITLEEMKQRATILPKGEFEFENALRKKGMSFICECKKKSPSKGIIDPVFNYIKIAKEYEKAGADCISVLTEPKWFLGCDKYLSEISSVVSIPCLRKDFVVDEYMIYQAKLLGASAILLICSILTENQLKDYIEICDEIGLSALVEAHDEKEIIMALNVKARIIGVNNRNLKDFSMNVENSYKLRKIVPKEVLFVSESGVQNGFDVKRLYDFGADAVLVGEALMRETDKKAKLIELRGAL